MKHLLLGAVTVILCGCATLNERQMAIRVNHNVGQQSHEPDFRDLCHRQVGRVMADARGSLGRHGGSMRDNYYTCGNSK